MTGNGDLKVKKIDNEWFVYTVLCRDGSLYTGVTNDLPARLAAHDGGRGARYTRGRGPVRLVWAEAASSRGEALRREAAIKKLKRPAKLKLIRDSGHGVLVIPRNLEAVPGCPPGEARIDRYRPESSSHRPPVSATLFWSEDGISGSFTVEDRYVRAAHTGFNEAVHRDSCVEFFFMPEGAPGYFTFEWNAVGALLAGYVTDPAREDGRVKGLALFSEAECRSVETATSLPREVLAEVGGQLRWTLVFRIPFNLLRKYAGDFRIGPGMSWRGNFYKCGDSTSHPHWGSWRELPERNFHMPDSFGILVFG